MYRVFLLAQPGYGNARERVEEFTNGQYYSLVLYGSLSTLMLYVEYGNMPSVGQCTI